VETSILDLAQTINRLTGSDVPIDLRPKRDWDRSGRRLGSTVKAARDLGFNAETSLDEGLKRTIAWTRENMPLIDACIAQHAQHMKGDTA
jgi:UDP-glucose 4-epimerase